MYKTSHRPYYRWSVSSEYWVIELHLCTCLHHILECSNLVLICAAWGTEMAWLWRFLVWIHLFSDCWCYIVSLILVRELLSLSWSACLRESPSWEVKLIRRIRRCLGHISSRTYSYGSWSLNFQTTTSAISKGIFRVNRELWLITRQVLRTWGLLKRVSLHLKNHLFYKNLLLARFRS